LANARRKFAEFIKATRKGQSLTAPQEVASEAIRLIYIIYHLPCLTRIKFKTGNNHCNQTINTTSKVCISGTEVDVFESGSIVKHFSRPL